MKKIKHKKESSNKILVSAQNYFTSEKKYVRDRISIDETLEQHLVDYPDLKNVDKNSDR